MSLSIAYLKWQISATICVCNYVFVYRILKVADVNHDMFVIMSLSITYLKWQTTTTICVCNHVFVYHILKVADVNHDMCL